MMTWRVLTNQNEESDVARDQQRCDVGESQETVRYNAVVLKLNLLN